MNRYLALMRGINVGGNNIIKMVELKTAFETMGFTNVTTYIQSGNVIFSSEQDDQIKLEALIEKVLSNTFHYSSRVVVVSHRQLKAVVEENPDGFGLYPETHKYDIVFLKNPLTSESALSEVLARKDIDQVYAMNGVLYFSRLISNLTRSYLSKIITLPIYKFMTIRNWNTTSKLLVLMEK